MMIKILSLRFAVALAVMKEGRPYEPAPPRNHRPGHLKEA